MDGGVIGIRLGSTAVVRVLYTSGYAGDCFQFIYTITVRCSDSGLSLDDTSAAPEPDTVSLNITSGMAATPNRRFPIFSLAMTKVELRAC